MNNNSDLPTVEYFLQTKKNTWETVDEYIYKHWQYVFTTEDEPRYTGNSVVLMDNGEVSLNIDKITSHMLGVICRLCGATIPAGATHGGIAPEPKDLLIIKKKGTKHPIFYDVATKAQFKKVG